MRMLGPGIVDGDGELRFDLPSLCAAAGLPPTRANQERMEALVRDVIREHRPQTEIRVSESDEWPPPWLRP